MTGKDSSTVTNQSSMNLNAGKTDRFANKYKRKFKPVDLNIAIPSKTTESCTTRQDKHEMNRKLRLALQNYPMTSDVTTSRDRGSGVTLTHITNVLDIPNSPESKRESMMTQRFHHL